ncbi:phage derived protein Gp49-like [Candidatus Termititenax persephonae]|uniref:Phage derived protein Gp49-like n=1 Tax=Candidatus Termititenax persephonae TaxID=2218525 RepID=A0A388TG24_9BACT|nr:phage derived protein Gp49-like [Candidatus Termititenax persephonae]
MEYVIELYEKNSGNSPVLGFILSLAPKQQAKIYREIELLEKFGNALHFPHVRKIEGEKSLWELRIKFGSDAFRIFYFMFYANHCVLLHGFVKKANKTPQKELAVAVARINDYKRRKHL